MLNWEEVQNDAALLLAQGVFKLSIEKPCAPDAVSSTEPCNYLIYLNNNAMYVGEAASARDRVRQQFNNKISTVYKNYLRSGPDKILEISKFDLRLMKTHFGRKEIEEFAIVNMATALNRFQLGKRDLHVTVDSHQMWDVVQLESAALIKDGSSRCLNAEASPWKIASSLNVPGLYLIRNKNDQVIYVGESSDIGVRFATHGARTYFSAVRRNLGEQLLGFSLQVRNGKKRYFELEEDKRVTAFLEACSIAFIPVELGRFEVEELLIKQLQPVLNRKSRLV